MMWPTFLIAAGFILLYHQVFSQTCNVYGCCEVDCCAAGTYWDVSCDTCLEDPWSPGFSGDYPPDFEYGCPDRLCCEDGCCGTGTIYDMDIQCCVVDGTTGPTVAPAPGSSVSPSMAPSTNSSCPLKKIRMTKFCVQGEPDFLEQFGDDLEVYLQLDTNNRYYPTGPPPKEVDFNTCIDVPGAFINFPNWKSIFVGVEDVDTTTSNDVSNTANSPPSKWYSDICTPYEVRIYQEFNPEKTVSQCYSIGVENVAGSGFSGTFKRCENFTQPAEYLLWIVEVHPR